MLSESIAKLVQYGITTGLTPECERNYTTNLLLDVFKEDEYVELLLIGNRNFEIDKYTILKYIDNQRIIKIKDQTEIAYDLEKLSNTTTLKGLFVKKMLEKSQNKNISKDEKNIIEKAIEIGLEALE